MVRTERRHDPATGDAYPWLIDSTAMVNHYYVYLDDLKKIGFAANRRLLGVQRLSHDCTLGADVLDELHRPALIDGQRAPALRFGDPRVQSRAMSARERRQLPGPQRCARIAALMAPALPASLDLAIGNVAAAVQGREPVYVYYSLSHDPPQTTGPGRGIGTQPGLEP